MEGRKLISKNSANDNEETRSCTKLSIIKRKKKKRVNKSKVSSKKSKRSKVSKKSQLSRQSSGKKPLILNPEVYRNMISLNFKVEHFDETSENHKASPKKKKKKRFNRPQEHSSSNLLNANNVKFDVIEGLSSRQFTTNL
jgi:hypothetical protein